MELVNSCGLAVVWVTGSIRAPSPSVTIIVKGTYAMAADGVASPVPKQPPPGGHEFVDDDPEKELRYEYDFAPYKPGTDLLLVGHCHAPRKKAVDVCRTSFGVGGYVKTLAVIGNRFWRTSFLMSQATPPEPFVQMPLGWGHSFGGVDFPKNPLGKGTTLALAAGGELLVPLPNIESPDRLVTSPNDRPEPEGFGPIPLTWPQRGSRVGSYKGKWLKERFPWFPKDFDWKFFNAAPADQQLHGFLKGDEEIVLENLHPKHPTYRCRLPAQRIRCFMSELSGTRLALHEVSMVLDTLWVDADAEKLVLVWRGNRDVPSEKLPGFVHCFAVREPLTQAPKGLNDYREELAKILRSRKALAKEFVAEKPPAEAAPFPPDPVPPPGALLQIKEAQEAYQAAVSSAGGPLQNAGSPPPSSPAEVARQAAQALLKLRETLLALGKSVPPALDLAIASPMTIPDPVVSPPPKQEPTAPLPEPPPPPTREALEKKVRATRSLEGEDLTGVSLAGIDLSGVNLKGALLTRAYLRKAVLEGADLTGANLSDVDLMGARAHGAVFDDADLTEAVLIDADLTEAKFKGTDLTGANLQGARLGGAVGAGANLQRSILTSADLRGARFPGANLSQAVLDGADCSKADLSGASLIKSRAVKLRASEARLTEAKVMFANFRECDFSKIEAEMSVWEGARAPGCNFTLARLSRAEFSSAVLERARLPGANLKLARLVEANLRFADLTRSNLFRASLESADLSGADVREANLYEAETWKAVVEGAQFEGANLKKTKLSLGI